MKLVLAVVGIVAGAASAAAQPRLFANTVFNCWGWWDDPAVFRAYVDTSKARGFNAINLDVSWNTEREDASYDFSQFDEQARYVISKDMWVFVRINCSTIGDKVPYWFTDEHLMRNRDGTIYRHEHGGTVPCITHPMVLDKMVRFCGAVSKHCDEAFPLRPSGADPVVCLILSFTPTMECEYFFASELDFSESAEKGFSAWLGSEYSSIEELNAKWGTRFTDFAEIDLLSAHPTARYLYFENTLQVLYDRTAEAIHCASPRMKAGLQTGCIWDIPLRRTMRVTRLMRNLDWLFVADAPTYPHDFSVDYLRCSVPGKCVSNEIDGPYTKATNDEFARQAVETYQHGADALHCANWPQKDLADRRKWTFFDAGAQLARRPQDKPRSSAAIYLSTWDLINQEQYGSNLQAYQAAYRTLSNDGRIAVDIIPDQVIADDPSVLRGYEKIYLPLNCVVPREVRKALADYTGEVVVEQPDRAGTRDEYGRPVAALEL